LYEREQWLGRYAEIVKLADSGDRWTRFERAAPIDDAKANQFDVEFTATGGDCRVDDIDVRSTSASSQAGT